MNRMHYIMFHGGTERVLTGATKVTTWFLLSWLLMVLDGRTQPSNFIQAGTVAAIIQLAYIGLRRLT